MSSNSKENEDKLCQIQSVPRMAEPRIIADAESLPLTSRIKLVLKRLLSTSLKKRLKSNFDRLANWYSKFLGKSKPSPVELPVRPPLNLKAGDWVRVRSREEIEPTLDHWDELKGCGFMEDMWPYCGTVHRVLKPVQRFVDERDYKIKRVIGVALLEGVICQGTTLYGKCDRSCFFFWREEWLEKVEKTVENFGGSDEA